MICSAQNNKDIFSLPSLGFVLSFCRALKVFVFSSRIALLVLKLDMLILCYYIVLFKDKYNHLEFLFGLLESDVCEFFSNKVGGMISNEKNYDGIDLVESARALARIAEFEADPIGPCFGRAHKKQTHMWNEVEKNSTLEVADLRDYSCVENDDFIVLALNSRDLRNVC